MSLLGRRMAVGIAAGAAMWTAAGLVRKARNPQWEEDLATWQQRWSRKGLPGTPGELTTFGIVAAFGGVHAVGYVCLLPVLPKGGVRSGVAYGLATNAFLWTVTWAASRYLGATKQPTWADGREAVRSAAYGAMLGGIVARA